MKWLLVVSLLIWYCLYEWELECSKQQTMSKILDLKRREGKKLIAKLWSFDSFHECKQEMKWV